MDILRVCWAYCQAATRAHVKDERGASLVEYTFLLAFIAIIAIAAITFLGDTTNAKLSQTGSALQ